MGDLHDLTRGAFEKTAARPRPPAPDEVALELAHCAADAVYFVNRYVKIFDNETRGWIPFTMWPFQSRALRDLIALDENGDALYRRIVALKTRQIGFTWLFGVAHKLWKMRFQPITEVLVFSQSDEDAMAVLGEQRFRGTYKLLPDWMKIDVTTDSAHEFRLSNGSGIRALPESRGGDSRTVTDVFIDEADLITDLDNLLARAKPTLGTKGQLIVNGRAVKEKPNSAFKRLYLQAKKGEGEWNKAIFVPWYAHPLRTKAWKDALDAETFTLTGTLDSVHEHYPETDLEALSARTLDKRFAPAHIASIYRELPSLPPQKDTPTLPGLKIYAYPEPGRKYGLGADPSGGESDGDPAVACVVDHETKAQVAVLAGKIEPTTFGDNIADLSLYYFGAPVEFELNNHGHAVRAKLRERGTTMRNGQTKNGPSRFPGWLTTEWSKKLLYDTAAGVVQDAILEASQAGTDVVPIIFDFTTATEIASIDANGLSAPEGQHDDHSVAWALAEMCVHVGVPSMSQQKFTGLWGNSARPMPTLSHAAPAVALVQAQTEEGVAAPYATMSDKAWLDQLRARTRYGR